VRLVYADQQDWILLSNRKGGRCALRVSLGMTLVKLMGAQSVQTLPNCTRLLRLTSDMP
jgi:hypothetical protein